MLIHVHQRLNFSYPFFSVLYLPRSERSHKALALGLPSDDGRQRALVSPPSEVTTELQPRRVSEVTKRHSFGISERGEGVSSFCFSSSEDTTPTSERSHKASQLWDFRARRGCIELLFLIERRYMPVRAR